MKVRTADAGGGHAHTNAFTGRRIDFDDLGPSVCRSYRSHRARLTIIGCVT
jgi:hypothetical protein